MKQSKHVPTLLKRVAAVALMAFFFSGCGDGPAGQQEVVRPVKLLEIGAGGAGRVREYPGKVEALQDAEMGFEVAGKVIEFPVREGQRVQEGEVLARLDPRDFQAALDAKLARERTTGTDLERAKVLLREGVIAQRDFDLAQRAYEEAKADADIARKALDDTVLKAPFSGTVAKKVKQDFKNVQAKEPVLLLQDASRLKLTVNLPERDYARARPGLTLEQRNAGLQANVVISSLPDRAFPARIAEFATTADPATRTYEVTFLFNAPADVTINPGMTAKVQVAIEDGAARSGSLRIPSHAAITDHSGKPFVWLVDRKAMTVSRREVELGPLEGGSVTIRRGLADGDVIAVSGVQQLREGMKVSQLK